MQRQRDAGKKEYECKALWGEGAKIFTTSKEGRKGMLWKGTRIWKEGFGCRIFPTSRPSREGFIKIERRC